MRTVSLNARVAYDADTTTQIDVVLLYITHPDFPDPIKLSTDPTSPLSYEPLEYGTRSTWHNTPSDDPFKFVLIDVTLPDDVSDAPAAATFLFEAFDNRLAEVFRSTIKQATVDMAVVMAATPDIIEAEWRGMKLVSAEGDMNRVSVQITRAPITAEPWPAHRMTRYRFPGLVA